MKCQAGFEIERDLCTKCGASNRDVCGDMDGEVYSDGLEILALRKALTETERRLQHLRNELSGRLSGDAATKFFGVTDTTISLIETALQ